MVAFDVHLKRYKLGHRNNSLQKVWRPQLATGSLQLYRGKCLYRHIPNSSVVIRFRSQEEGICPGQAHLCSKQHDLLSYNRQTRQSINVPGVTNSNEQCHGTLYF